MARMKWTSYNFCDPLFEEMGDVVEPIEQFRARCTATSTHQVEDIARLVTLHEQQQYEHDEDV